MSQRISALTERLEIAHGPALEAMRAELAKVQAQSCHEVEGHHGIAPQLDAKAQ